MIKNIFIAVIVVINFVKFLLTIKRLDQGHLNPLGERHAGQTMVTGGARTSTPLHRRRPLYLKCYLDIL